MRGLRRRGSWFAAGLLAVAATLGASGHAVAAMPAVGHDVASSVNWHIVNSPNTSSTDNVLGGVDCVSTSFCVTAGFTFHGQVDRTLIERWNGSTWSVVSSPNQPSNEEDTLLAVSCVTTVFCRAVGDYINDSMDAHLTLVEKWNGAAWSLVTSPNKQAFQNNLLQGASCVSTTDCTATGYYEFNAANAETLIESSNGRMWSLVMSPNRTTVEDNILNGVSCAVEALCVAVGSYNDTPGRRTLIESWNGSAWNVTTSPNRAQRITSCAP